MMQKNPQENVSLASLTTFRIGGEARFLWRAASIASLREGISFAAEKKLPFFVLGGGSNILASDGSFAGIVIRMEIRGVEFRELPHDEAEARVGAGENWDEFVAEAVKRGFCGVENLSLIPGTVGAAPVQNIGAYGVEAAQSIISVETFDPRTMKVETLMNADCRFGYRDSIFKRPEGRHLIITEVTFRLRKNAKLHTDYKDIQKYFADRSISSPSVAEVRDAVIAIRTAKLPDVSKLGTAGSFFKNPIIEKSLLNELLKSFPLLPSFPVESGEENKAKVPAAWILDNLCGFRGYRSGSIGTYERQALVLVNFGGGTEASIMELAARMQACVREKTGIELELEVVRLGN